MDDNDTKQQQASTGLERFSHLENRIFQAVEEIKAIRKENEALRGENSRLNERIRENEALREEIGRLTAQAAEEREKLYGENEDLRQKIAQSESDAMEMLTQFEKEREELRSRVENTLTLLASLDTQELSAD